MPNYLTPGVYVEEVPGGPRVITAVGTQTAAFIGIAPNPTAHVNEAFPVNNWTQFVREFASNEGAVSTPLSHAVYGFFLNGGGRCYVVNVGPNGSITGQGRDREGLEVLEEIDEVAIVAVPAFTDAGSYDAVLTHCEKLKDRVAILDAPLEVPDVMALTRVGTAPSRRSPPAEEGGEDDSGPSGVKPRQSDGGYGALYYPWIEVRDPLGGGDDPVPVPPSGHMAGIWARTDSTRGVHKAPANETVRGALNVTKRLTAEEQGELNSAGVNCIRFFTREGIRVWGARTLADPSSEWRYLNVRRLVNMIEESIVESTRWIVFEPNDYSLWRLISRDLSAFLTRVWRDGALMGRTPEEAFFVQCDEETNPPEVVEAGRVETLIGLAPVKPAEFIVFRISQFQGGVEIQAEAG